jgi:hypothetical protein
MRLQGVQFGATRGVRVLGDAVLVEANPTGIANTAIVGARETLGAKRKAGGASIPRALVVVTLDVQPIPFVFDRGRLAARGAGHRVVANHMGGF